MVGVMKRILIVLFVIGLIGCTDTGQNEQADNKNVAELEETENVSVVPVDVSDIIEKLSLVSNMRNISIHIDGETISEAYFNGCKETSKNNVFSVTKSITSLLVGIAIEQGYIEDIDQSIGDYIDLAAYDAIDASKITIRNLLTMSAGIQWDSSDLSSEYIQLKAAIDPIELVLERGVSVTPGTVFNYSDGSAHLVAEILTKATGMSVEEFAKVYLFTPLGIEDIMWSKAQDGVNMGGCDLHLTGQDMAKIGQLVLQDGQFNNQQIVSTKWLEASTSVQLPITSYTSHNSGYGYFWWLGTVEQSSVISALGHGGQFIVIVPDHQIVITASTIGGTSDQKAAQQFNDVERIIYFELIPQIITYQSSTSVESDVD